MWDIVTKFEEVRQIKLVVIWLSGNFLKTFGAYVACFSVVIPKFWHSIIEKNGRGQLTFYATHYVQILKYATLKAEWAFFMIFSVLLIESKFYLKDSQSQISIRLNQGVVSWCSVNYAT